MYGSKVSFGLTKKLGDAFFVETFLLFFNILKMDINFSINLISYLKTAHRARTELEYSIFITENGGLKMMPNKICTKFLTSISQSKNN